MTTIIIERTKSFLNLLFLIIVALVLIFNFQSLSRAVQNLLEQVAAVNAIEFFGFKVSFSGRSVEQDLKSALADYKPSDFEKLGFKTAEAYKDHLVELIQGLGPKEFDRLMYIDGLKDLCEFERPTLNMIRAVAADQRLEYKGLSTIKDSPATLASVRERMQEKSARGEKMTIGNPRSCYEMQLTDTGYNVKTVFVRTMSRGFSS
ncbi:MAG: hypothetical protein ABWY12_10870 [Burkholderiales bacterium]